MTNFRNLIISLFGTYAPLVNSDGSYVEGIAGVDWTYILGVQLFIVVLYCVLRMIGGVLSGK